MREILRIAVLLAAVLALTTACPSRADEPDTAAAAGAKSKQAAKKPRPRITISKETTYIVGPLREDGYVDYVAALNERCSKGVTPENNAAVLFWQAIGPAEIEEKHRGRFFKMLGTPRLADEGEYFIRLWKYAEQLQEKEQLRVEDPNENGPTVDLYDKVDQAMERPWSKKEYPELAGWLQANKKPLRLIVKGTRRPRYYSPMIASDDPMLLVAILPPQIVELRDVAKALTIRAMLCLQAGNVENAWQDLLACHRLARLTGQGPTLVEKLVAMQIDLFAFSGDAAVARHGKLTAAKARKFWRDLRKLPPTPKLAEAVNVAERFNYLDAVAAVARRGPAALSGVYFGMEPPVLSATRNPVANAAIMVLADMLVDWDEVLRTGNSWYDQIGEALSRPTPAQRIEALSKLAEEAQALRNQMTYPRLCAKSFLSLRSPRTTIGRKVGEALTLFVFVMPPAPGMRNAEHRVTVRSDLAQLTFTLAAYHADHGAYPPSLDNLAPKYIDKVAKDIFADGEFHYRREGKGYVLYSVGPNGKDDGGRNYDDIPEDDLDSDFDDIVIRTPPEKR